MEIRLPDGAVADRDLPVQGRREAVCNAAFHLRGEVVGMHGITGIHGADDAPRPRLAVDDLDVHDLGDDGAEGAMNGDAAAHVVRHAPAPAGLLRREVQHGPEAG